MATFLQVSARGGFTTGAWSGEVAQCGWSFPIVDFNPATSAVVNADIEEPEYDDSAASGSWAHGTYLQGFGGQDIPQEAQEDVVDAVYAWMSSMHTFQVSSFKWAAIVLQLIQWDEVPPTGWGQKFEASTYAINPQYAGNASGTGNLPPQCAAVVSHYTGSTGSRNRGRVYVPMHKAIDSTMLIPAATINTLGTAESDFFDAIAAIALPGDLHLCPAVVSRKYQSYSSIVQVRVGDEIDTQRRRKNARTETYTEFDWPGA